MGKIDVDLAPEQTQKKLLQKELRSRGFSSRQAKRATRNLSPDLVSFYHSVIGALSEVFLRTYLLVRRTPHNITACDNHPHRRGSDHQ